jgi:hypothetical protein
MKRFHGIVLTAAGLIAMASCRLGQAFVAVSLSLRPPRHHLGNHEVLSPLLATSSTKEEWAPILEGLMDQDEFERLDAIDHVIRVLCTQLPSILTKPLTTASASDVYGDNFCLSVQVTDDDDGDHGTSNDSHSPMQTTTHGDDIVVLRGQKDLIALSDVLVLATAAAQQAGVAISGGAVDTSVEVQCQILVDDSYRVLRIPWKAKAPLVGSPNSNNNRFEGVTDFCLDTEVSEGSLKVQRIVIRKLNWNSNELNGPAIGQALKTIRNTVSNLQLNPLFRGLIGSTTENRSNPTSSFFNALRDEFLDQAATAVFSQRLSAGGTAESENDAFKAVQVMRVASMESAGWMQIPNVSEAQYQSNYNGTIDEIPCPGTEEWMEYAGSRSRLTRFCTDIIPRLSLLSIVDPGLFAKDVQYKANDGSSLLQGREKLANYYQTLALTRKATGGSWKMTRCELLDWKENQVAVDYEATTSSLPQWKIQGSDIFSLDASLPGEERPVIKKIQQQSLRAVNPNGSVSSLDSQWLVKNIVNALDGDSVKASRDFLTELLMQQPGTTSALKTAKASTRPDKKVSPQTAAKIYYIMDDLHSQAVDILNVSSARSSPPISEYLDDNVELRGYLGESILKGANLYMRTIGSVALGIRDSIRQKRLVLETLESPRIELLPTRDIRLSQVFRLRIPTPGAGVILPESAVSPPIKVELVSEYKIDSSTGMIIQHRLIETRINGQLTPGDQISRWIKRFLNNDNSSVLPEDRSRDDIARAISDTLSFFRSINGTEKK